MRHGLVHFGIALTMGIFCIGCDDLILSAGAQDNHIEIPVVESIYWSDGDSGWINGKSTGFPFRLANIDAPPIGECRLADVKAYASKEFAIKATKSVKDVRISNYYYDGPYGRHIIDISVYGEDLGLMSIDFGHAAPWGFRNGKATTKKPNWC